MCCLRYGGIDWRIASTVAPRPTRPVIPTYAPAMTIAPPSSFPSPAAMSVADTRNTRYRVSSSGCSNVASFTSTSPPVRTLGATGAQNLSCMATADHVCETSGGACRGASPTTTVPSVFIPRIAPP